MENWYTDNSFLTNEEGVFLTNHYKELGFVSAYEAFTFEHVDRVIHWLYILDENDDKAEDLRKKIRQAKSKNQKLELYKELGLLEYFQKISTMSKMNIDKFEISLLENLYYLKGQTDKEFQIIDKMVENHRKK
jgi:hypothetical protein